MYLYTDFDQQLIDERVAQFRDQTQRYLAGTLTEDEYRPLRLQNGLYVQRYAPMLRIAVPYGLLNSKQLRKVAEVSREYDRGYAHISTRQNIQLNWPELTDVPDILAELATVQMHAIQTSGNCIRNTTTDQFAGVVAGEVTDPRPTCELIRQWSTFHPEFAFLPRKFKIAVSALEEVDRAATAFHDIGVYIVKNEAGETGYRIMVGGGLGRTPIIGSVIREFLPREDLIGYLEAVLRVYNLHGRRDNKYKARIKILVKALTPAVFAEKVEAEFAIIRDERRIAPEFLAKLDREFTPFNYQKLDDVDFSQVFAENPKFANWYRHNTNAHKVTGYRIVTISLKRAGIAPGDLTSEELELIADLADKYTFGELRTTHEQNIALVDVPQQALFDLWQVLDKHNMARAHIGFITDIVCCPGGDFCSLANAKSIPISEAISRRFDDLDAVYNLGPIDLNISGCMNACGHHHVGHIGILGVDKKGDEFYQVSLGGNSNHDASLGDILGPSFGANDMPDIIEEILNTYLDLRQQGERFLDTYRRIGIQPFKERVMPNNTTDKTQVLYKDGSIADNQYQLIAEDGVLPAGDVLLKTAELELLAQVQGKKGLFITVNDSPEEHQYPLNELDVIAIEFAGFADGRGYSFAALLRRQGFKGELRAVGDVFKDVLNYLKRSGFDSFVLKEGKDIHEAASGLKDFTSPYQASVAVANSSYQTGKAFNS